MRFLPALVALASLLPGTPHAQPVSAPTVVELFTSQGCYSCPPAERFVGDLARRDDVLALEFHVDYWDDLVYGSAGKWKDVFSQRAFTIRQSRYNRRLRGRADVYTPQMVIDGRFEAVGSSRTAVLSQVRRAASERDNRISVAVTRTGANGVKVQLTGESSAPAAVWLVRFITQRTTVVRAGENMGKTLTSSHVVTEMRRIGDWSGTARTIEVSDFALREDESCAVLVQTEAPGPIMGAARCSGPAS